MHIYATKCTYTRRIAQIGDELLTAFLTKRKKEDVKGWIRPDGDPGSIAEKALTNMVFEKAVEYYRSPTEFIAM